MRPARQAWRRWSRPPGMSSARSTSTAPTLASRGSAVRKRPSRTGRIPGRSTSWRTFARPGCCSGRGWSGHLISTVSAAGLLAMPGTAPYSVTKHAALSFAEWLAFSYAHRGITVQAICPLGVRTPMLPGPGDPGAKLLADAAIEPEAVADAVISGIADGRFLILPHPEVAGMYAGRAADPDHWRDAMNNIQQFLESP